MENRKPKITGLKLKLLYLCLDEYKHPLELMKILGGNQVSYYDRNISKYLSKLENDGLMISKWEDNKKYFKTDIRKWAKQSIEAVKRRRRMIKDEMKKVKSEKRMPYSYRRHVLKLLGISYKENKIVSEKEIIRQFRKMFMISGGVVYIKEHKPAETNWKKLIEVRKPS